MLASNISFLRKQKKLKQAEMLTMFGVHPTTWSDYERGKTTPSIELLISISEYFGIDVKDLVKKNLANLSFDENEATQNSDTKPKISPKIIPKISEELNDLNSVAAPVVNLMPKVVTVDGGGNDNMVLVDVKARAGYLNGYGDPSFIKELQSFRLPNYKNGNYRMFEVAGLSMYPTLNDGDILITRAVESIDGIVNDRIHVVVTLNDGIVVKRVLNRVETDVKLILKSDNVKDRHEYPNMVIHPTEVREIWFVVAYISCIMKSPTEMYERIIDLEGRLTILEHNQKKARQ